MDDHAHKMLEEASRRLQRERALRVHQNLRLLKLLKEERKKRIQFQASFLAMRVE